MSAGLEGKELDIYSERMRKADDAEGEEAGGGAAAEGDDRAAAFRKRQRTEPEHREVTLTCVLGGSAQSHDDAGGV